MRAMIRGIGLRGAVALNVITMIGIGPLVTIPLVVAQLAGPLALVGWIAGAIVALCDGLVWAELGSQYPGSGGTYVYLRETFGAHRWGHLLAFLFNWQFFLYAPFLLASGYIGFAQYAGYLLPSVAASALLQHALEVAVGLATIALLYRRITDVSAVGMLLGIAAVGTLLLVIAAALPHADLHRALTLAKPVAFGWGFVGGLGSALFVTLYDYVGYGDAALLGDEVRRPNRTIPRAIVLSIVVVAVLYIALQVGVLGVVPWQHLVGRAGAPAPADAQFVASTVVEQAWGRWAARAVTLLILLTAFASVYGNLLGFSRIPYAAAKDGAFLPVFARLHPRGGFPYVGLLVLGGLSLVACFLPLDLVIAILTAGIVLIQSVMQIVALGVLRARGLQAPFRMWLFPLPALVALAGWLLAFLNTGTMAMLLGLAWLLAGAVVYLAVARAQRAWPFALAAFCLAAAAVLAGSPPAAANEVWHASAIASEGGHPVFTVDGKPFFVYGAAFFYERIPRRQWAPALRAYRAMGINTIDLYVIWNWHEPQPGVFDFTGRTNPRRDLRGLLALVHAMGFKLIVRPGPVIRNEWRNGGYPAWLLKRPEYDMPLHDVLQGRYPATATLQNTHADDAAREWLHNRTHLRYAAQWLRTALHEIAPWKDDVIAVALDDDQGAYIDNQTWPAPHFTRYLDWCKSVVRGVVGDKLPLFINTYQMKVTAAAPVWAWGNWYQSNAYRIGEHDLAQLAFSTGLLQTQPHLPVMSSEFQAGWLQGAAEAAPRAADPSNTTLALHEMLEMGLHGVVNFPVQDTFDPAGWEAPWANAFYDWDAALSLQLGAQPRYAPTAAFGALVTRYGRALARTHVRADLGIAYLTSAYHAAALSNAQIAQIAAATIAAQRACAAAALSCRLVDLRYASPADLRRYPALVLPPAGLPLRFEAAVRAKLEAYRSGGGRTIESPVQAGILHPAAGGIAHAALLVADDGTFGFLDAINPSDRSVRTPTATLRLGSQTVFVAPHAIPARGALLLPLGKLAARDAVPAPAPSVPRRGRNAIPLRDDAFVAGTRFERVPPHRAIAYERDVFADGEPSVVFDNGRVRLIVSPDAGARAFVFEDLATTRNLFSTVGGMRDDVCAPIAPSARDYIAAYTHPIPAGFFIRPYDVRVLGRSPAFAEFSYHAPDVLPEGALFERVVTMAPGTRRFTVDERVRFGSAPAARNQCAVVESSFATAPSTATIRTGNGAAFFDPQAGLVTFVAWPASDVRAAAITPEPGNALVTLRLARGGWRRTAYGFAHASSLAAARSVFEAFAAGIRPALQGRRRAGSNRP